jgi:hypothetical protein
VAGIPVGGLAYDHEEYTVGICAVAAVSSTTLPSRYAASVADVLA